MHLTLAFPSKLGILPSSRKPLSWGCIPFLQKVEKVHQDLWILFWIKFFGFFFIKCVPSYLAVFNILARLFRKLQQFALFAHILRWICHLVNPHDNLFNWGRKGASFFTIFCRIIWFDFKTWFDNFNFILHLFDDQD